MAALMCFWCVCTILQQKIMSCDPCGSGPRAGLIQEAQRVLGAGQMLTAECVEHPEKPELNWSEKKGWRFGKD